MNLRAFLASLVGVVSCPWKAMSKPVEYKPLLKQVFPTKLEELPGLICKWRYSDEPYPYEIVREYDELTETWEGQHLYNPRRNKWWAKDASGKIVLICTGSQFNDDSTLFFKRIC